MLRIRRIVKKDILYDILKLKHVSKIEIKQGENSNMRDPTVCKVLIYIRISGFGRMITNLLKWAKSYNDPSILGSVQIASVNS